MMNPTHALERGRRLRQARLAAGFKTARAFAETCHLAQSTYSQYETGKRAFNADILTWLCIELQMDAHWLLFGREPMVGEPRMFPAQCLKKSDTTRTEETFPIKHTLSPTHAHKQVA